MKSKSPRPPPKSKFSPPTAPGTTAPSTEIVAVPVDSSLALVSEALPKDRNPYYVYLGRFSSKNSRETMAYALRAVAGVMAGAAPYKEGGPDISNTNLVNPAAFPWWNLRYQHVERIKASLMQHHAAPTVNKILSALRQVIDCSRKLELMDANQCAAAMDVKSVKFSRVKAGRRAETDEIERLVASMPENSLSELRNRAVVATTYYAGLRRSEISWLTMSRVSVRERNLRVLGKGNKERNVMIVDKLMTTLGPWLEARGQTTGALFCSVSDNHPVAEHALSPQYIYDIIVAAADKCALTHLSPHDLRRSFITNGIEDGVDPLVMSKIVGHDQVQTTLGYDMRGEKAQRDQMAKAFGEKP